MFINPQTNEQDRSKHEDVRQDDEPKVEQGTDFELHSDLANIGPIPSQHAISDPQVLRLLANMHEEVQSGCPGGKTYSEALSLALASYLLARCAKAVHVERSAITFSHAQAARLQDFIQANRTRDIALSELADLVGLSAHYFSFLFKNTFRVAPHHYLLRERIHEGQKLLVSGRLSICEVALALGFSDQSHFTHVFRKVTGITPRRYQRIS